MEIRFIFKNYVMKLCCVGVEWKFKNLVGGEIVVVGNMD